MIASLAGIDPAPFSDRLMLTSSLIGAALSRARWNTKKVAIFLGHFSAMSSAKNNFHSFDESIWKLLHAFQCSAFLIDVVGRWHPCGVPPLAWYVRELARFDG